MSKADDKPLIKNERQRHIWQPIREGEPLGHGLIYLICSVCGEDTTVGISLSDAIRTRTGCYRPGSLPYRQDDLVVCRGRLDTVQAVLSDGTILTWNAGGHSHFMAPAEVRPY